MCINSCNSSLPWIKNIFKTGGGSFMYSYKSSNTLHRKFPNIYPADTALPLYVGMINAHRILTNWVTLPSVQVSVLTFLYVEWQHFCTTLTIYLKQKWSGREVCGFFFWGGFTFLECMWCTQIPKASPLNKNEQNLPSHSTLTTVLNMSYGHTITVFR